MYIQLTQEERYQIHAFPKAGHDPTEIAEALGRHKSTISRELKRNRGLLGYQPKQAKELARSQLAVGHVSWRRNRTKPGCRE